MPEAIIEEHISEQVRIVGEVFGVMADIVIERIFPSPQAPWPPDEELVTAAIYFTEPWKGAMMLECVLPLAFAFTSRLMSVPLPTSVDADVCDSMSELMNMIAGNFKALMPPETGISIPSVVRGRDYILQMRGTKTFSQTAFRTELGEFCLTLVGQNLA
jgi:CheY-specific phosphatase CheX